MAALVTSASARAQNAGAATQRSLLGEGPKLLAVTNSCTDANLSSSSGPSSWTLSRYYSQANVGSQLSAFSTLRPCSWTQVQNLDPEYGDASTTGRLSFASLFTAASLAPGVLASFYNSKEPGAETVAVYAKATQLGSTRDLGSAKVLTICRQSLFITSFIILPNLIRQDVGQALADVAPFGQLMEHGSYTSDGLTYYTCRQYNVHAFVSCDTCPCVPFVESNSEVARLECLEPSKSTAVLLFARLQD